MELELDIPFVWPDARVIKGLARYWSLSPIKHACIRATGLFGMVTDLSGEGITWFRNLCDDSGFEARIIVVLYPASATGQEDLEELQAIQAQSGGRAQVRLHLVKHRGKPTANVTWFRTRDDAQGFLVVGPAGNFGYFSGTCVTDVNLAFRPNAILLDQVRNVFDYVWALSSPLTDANVAIPALEPAPGDPEAQRMWLDFMAKCPLEEGHIEKVHVDLETGQVSIKSGTASTDPVSPTVELGACPLSKLQRELGALYAKGALVTIEKTSRIPPIDAPVKPEWFGLESFRQTGTVTRRVSFSVSPFDEALRSRIDRLRKRPTELLPRFTYQLADSVRWMPDTARALFKAELKRAENEWTQLLGKQVGKDIKSFVNGQCDRIRKDAHAMYRTVNPGGQLPEAALTEILQEITCRLERAIQGSSLLPQLTFSPIEYRVEESRNTSSWGQAYTLLKSIAEFGRDRYASSFFFQGIDVDEEEYCTAMNVCGEYLFTPQGARGARGRAREERQMIRALDEVPLDLQCKCEALWALAHLGEQSPLRALIGDKEPGA